MSVNYFLRGNSGLPNAKYCEPSFNSCVFALPVTTVASVCPAPQGCVTLGGTAREELKTPSHNFQHKAAGANLAFIAQRAARLLWTAPQGCSVLTQNCLNRMETAVRVSTACWEPLLLRRRMASLVRLSCLFPFVWSSSVVV